MTEKEAKTKWCPHAVASHTNPRQKLMGDDWLHACIGSACMAWRAEDPYEYGTSRVEGGMTGGTPRPDERIDWEHMDRRPLPRSYTIGEPTYWRRLKDEPIGGYCGLAGKP